MNRRTLDRRASRQVDRRAMEDYGMSGLVLMENAGRGTADVLCQLGIAGPVLVCCGKGNNAGDGFVIARHLDLRGYAVQVALWTNAEELTGDAAVNFQILRKTDVPILPVTSAQDLPLFDEQLAQAAWIVDALLGTGAQGEPRPPLDSAIDRMNGATNAKRLAVDLPSGLDCDTGQPSSHTVRADHTCTFVAAKPGFFAPGADRYTGELHVLDIGIPRKLLEEVVGVRSGAD